MDSCIFCRCSTTTATREHILPESLGGGDWACAPKGVVCSGCNQYFGSKVEPLALGSYPFLPWRVLLGMPTKKGKSPFIDVPEGRLVGTGPLGCLGFEPSPAYDVPRRGEIRIEADPKEPTATCRLLLKMGLETLAIHEPGYVRGRRFDAARKFARAPSKGSRWWFLIQDDPPFSQNVVEARDVAFEVAQLDGGEVFHLALFSLHMFVPLETRIVPDPALHRPPRSRLVEARV
jgi:hypothetical protein